MSAIISDLEDLVRQWANARSEKFGTTCKWVDLHARQSDMSQYQQYKLNIQVINVHYGSDISSYEMPGHIMEDTTINDSSLPQSAVFRHTKETTSSFTWTLKNTIRTGMDTKFSVFIIPIISTTINSTEISTETTLSKTETEVESWTIERHVTVPAKMKMEMIWTVKEQEASGTFYADVKLTGHIACWNEDAIDVNDPDGDDVHYLWFTKISKVFKELREWGISIPPQYNILKSSVLYRITGECKGISGYDTTFVLNETSLNSTKTTQVCKCINAEHIPAV